MLKSLPDTVPDISYAEMNKINIVFNAVSLNMSAGGEEM